MEYTATDDLTLKNGLSAWITVDDEPLPIFVYKGSLRRPPNTSISGWIPSEAGKRFSIHWSDNSEKRRGISSVISLNGVGKYDGPLLTPSDRDREVECEYIRLSDRIIRYLEFTRLDTTDDPEKIGYAPKELGRIDLKLHKLRRVGRPRKQPQPVLTTPEDLEAPEHFAVDERTKILQKDCARLGEDVVNVDRGHAFFPSEPYPTPVAHFTFWYRTMDVLQAEGKAPRSSVSPSLERDMGPQHDPRSPSPASPTLEEELDHQSIEDGVVGPHLQQDEHCLSSAQENQFRCTPASASSSTAEDSFDNIGHDQSRSSSKSHFVKQEEIEHMPLVVITSFPSSMFRTGNQFSSAGTK
ncbi:hypothetical protein JAAARDRAFT_332969 [Jaapia argillacea MUCL 33604]|uniref:DUF7918 domain-containing protein n=1 Tax=Jaapia argillacea MUCL 33604 TaxID=933084 RepID=A0A067PVI8_9AGAM|nr:hypothetical protein JAAARDRAFT_332969 [Jaapia argillacea MUCL 33604]